MRTSSVLSVFYALVCALAIVIAVPLASGQSQARFVPPHADRGVDTDGDSMFNSLHVDVHLDASVGGNFFIVATLFNSTHTTEIAFQAVFPTITGPATVVVDFTGYEIRNSGFDG